MNNGYVYPSRDNYPGFRSNVTRNMYSDNYLSMAKGKKASFYLSFGNSREWRDTIIKGTIQDSQNDYTLVRDMTTGKLTMIYNMFIDYIIFED